MFVFGEKINMKNNKKLAIAGVSALGLAAVGFGAFAFFSDSAEQNTDGTVGTVDVSSKGNLTLSNSGNINPGDEEPGKENRDDTTSHELNFGITNDGTKSIVTRNIIDIMVDSHYQLEADGSLSITEDTVDGVTNKKYIEVAEDGRVNLDPSIFHLYVKTGTEGNYTNTKIEEVAGLNTSKPIILVKGMKDGQPVEVTVEERNDTTKIDAAGQKLVLRYIIEGATLGGTFGDGEDADTVVVDNDYVKVTAGTDANKQASAEYRYFLGMDSAQTTDPSLDGMVKNDKYQGSHLTIDLTVQAMQYRNTDAGDYVNGGDWQTVYTDTFTTGGTKTATP